MSAPLLVFERRCKRRWDGRVPTLARSETPSLRHSVMKILWAATRVYGGSVAASVSSVSSPDPHEPEPALPCRAHLIDEWLRSRRVRKPVDRVLPGLLHDAEIAHEVADPQQRRARLARTEEVPGPAQFEVLLRQ